VVIGGVFSSLVLTLLLVPIAYIWLAPEHVISNTTPPANGKRPSQASRPREAAPA
jgi:hypothetical protein